MIVFRKNKYESIFRTILWITVVLLILIILTFAIIRLRDVNLAVSSETMPPKDTIEYGYARRPLLTYLHILPGILFVLFGAMQFIKSFRNRFINIHRWIGRIYLLLGLVIGITAIIMGLLIRFGGIVESSAVTIFGIYFLFGLLRAYTHIRNKEYQLHREWMIRAYSIGLAVATMRPVIGLLIAFTNIPFNKFFGYTFWFAFIIHFMVAEIWIRYTRQKIEKLNTHSF